MAGLRSTRRLNSNKTSLTYPPRMGRTLSQNRYLQERKGQVNVLRGIVLLATKAILHTKKRSFAWEEGVFLI